MMEPKKFELIKRNIKTILVEIGEEPSREGLKDTPERVASMFIELFRGYNESEKPDVTTFPNNKDGFNCNQMIFDSGPFYSMCEHHMVPFFGVYRFGYLPDKKVVGLSKVARIVDFYSAKLQVQERLGEEIVNDLEKEIEPLGMGLVLKARHLCREMRGAKKIGGEMVTSVLRGDLEKESAKSEFLRFALGRNSREII
ncbi:MAG: GTP cyclohydrolase I [Planctomycetota bacterium]|jgi:GTP cyclohydrolase I